MNNKVGLLKTYGDLWEVVDVNSNGLKLKSTTDGRHVWAGYGTDMLKKSKICSRPKDGGK
jgi:hypothetical protein